MGIEDIQKLIPAWILNSKNLLLNITDLEGKYIFINELFKKRFAFLNVDFIGLPFDATLHQDDAVLCNQAAYQCITQPEKVVEVMLRKPDEKGKEYYWTKWEFSLFKDEKGEAAGILCIGYDITETTHASELALEFTEKTEKIIENITDGFYVLDKEWRFIKLNEVTCQIWQIPKEKLLGKVLWEVFPDDEVNFNYPKEFKRAVAENVTVNFEDFRTNTKQWFSVTAYPSPEGLTVFFRDISFEREAREQLLHSQTKLRAILNSTTQSNVLLNSNYEVLSYNRHAAEKAHNYLNITLKEGMYLIKYVPHELLSDFKNDFNAAFAGNIIHLERELTLPNQRKIWLAVSYYPTHDEENKLIGVSINLQNITPRKEAEQSLRKSEYMLKAIYNSTSEACSFISPEGKMLYLNKVANEYVYQVFGKSPQVNEDYFGYILPELQESFRKNFQKALQGEIITTEETDGKHWYQFTFFPVYDDEGNLVGIADNVRDITRRKEAELEIINQNERLSAIAWQQAHEVRRPLANILGLIILLRDEKDLSTITTYISLLEESAHQLDQIIHTIIKYSRQQRSKDKLT